MAVVRYYTDAPACYDWGWTTEINPVAAVTRHKRDAVRLVEISDEWHAEQQAMRYHSGLNMVLNETQFLLELADATFGCILMALPDKKESKRNE